MNNHRATERFVAASQQRRIDRDEQVILERDWKRGSIRRTVEFLLIPFLLFLVDGVLLQGQVNDSNPAEMMEREGSGVLASTPNEGASLPSPEPTSRSEEVGTSRRDEQPSRAFPYPVDMILGPGSKAALTLGIYGGALRTFHTGEFVLTQDEVVCCQFDGGGGFGWSGGVRADYSPSLDGAWGASARISFQEEGGKFVGDPEIVPILGENNRVENLTFTNELDISTITLSVVPMVMFRAIDADLDLYITAGPAVAWRLSESQIKYESIESPSNVTYLDGTTEKRRENLQVGLTRSSRLSMVGGVELRYPVTERLSLATELLYLHPLTPFGEDQDWKVAEIIGDVGLLLRL